MPDRHSTPDQPLLTAYSTKSSHTSPAATRSTTLSARVSTNSMPAVRSSSTSPGKPASPITTLLPPASTSSGRPSAAALRTVATAWSVSAATVSVPAGPPRRSVVYAASESAGVSSWRGRLTSGTTFTLGSRGQGHSSAVRWSGENRDEQAARDEGLLARGPAGGQPRAAGCGGAGRAGCRGAFLPRVDRRRPGRARDRAAALGA